MHPTWDHMGANVLNEKEKKCPGCLLIDYRDYQFIMANNHSPSAILGETVRLYVPPEYIPDPLPKIHICSQGGPLLKVLKRIVKFQILTFCHCHSFFFSLWMFNIHEHEHDHEHCSQWGIIKCAISWKQLSEADQNLGLGVVTWSIQGTLNVECSMSTCSHSVQFEFSTTLYLENGWLQI